MHIQRILFSFFLFFPGSYVCLHFVLFSNQVSAFREENVAFIPSG